MNLPKIRKRIFERYEKSDHGIYFIDVTLPRVETLFNDFDKKSTYAKKELDEDIVEYLIDSAEDLRKQTYILRFFFEHPITEERQSRVMQSIKNYFSYRKALEERKFNDQIHSSWIHFCIGIFLLLAALWGLKIMSSSTSIVVEIVKEGLIIASWVSMWNAMDTFIVNWRPFRKRTKLFAKIAAADVTFKTIKPLIVQQEHR